MYSSPSSSSSSSASSASTSRSSSPPRPSTRQFSAAAIISILLLFLMFIIGLFYFFCIEKRQINGELYSRLDLKWHPEQIPLNHRPFLYDVELRVYFSWNRKNSTQFEDEDENRVDGQVAMTFESGGGSRILVHLKREIDIGEVLVMDDEVGRRIPVKRKQLIRENELFDIELGGEMRKKSNYTLRITYRAEISTDRQHGLFRIPYDHQRKYIIATHLQMSEARSIIPCIDVPSAKAHFDVTLIHPTGTNAVANMIEMSVTNEGANWTKTTFKRTPLMSTYLFAFVVSDFPFLERITNKGVRTRVYCDPEKLDHTELAVSILGPLLDFFEQYFNISYPLHKLDVFVLPNLEVAAMENWGLITIRQAEAVFMEKRFPVTQRQMTQEVIAHEVAHQWFGNLVTMKWWNNLWLNEGFATMIGVKAVDFLDNTTTRYTEMTADYMCHVLRHDQKPDSSAVSDKRIDSQNFLNSNNRVIVYKKAAIIIRMIERLVEEDVFQKGLHLFLHKNRYSNAEHVDLFEDLTHVHSSSSGGHLSGQQFSLNDVMDTWLRQPSFPVVHVRRKNQTHLILRQQRYNHNPLFQSDRENFTWIIPIFHDDPLTGKHKVKWIVDKNETIFNNTGQLLVDPHQLTYMRLNYSLEMYSEISTQLWIDHNKIPINSRSRLIDDTLAMAENGQIDYRIAFNMTMYLTKETEYRPFFTFSAYLDFFLLRMYFHEKFNVYREYVLTLITPLYDKIEKEGFEKKFDENYDDYRLRELIIFRSCQLGYEPCVELSKRNFEELQKNCSKNEQILSDIQCNQIPFYLRKQVYTTIVQKGTEKDFNFLFEKWKKEHVIIERERLFVAMCSTENRLLYQKIWLEVLLKKDRENIPEKIFACSKHLNRNCNALDFFIDRSKEIKKSLPKSIYKLFQTLISRGISTDRQLKQIEKMREMYNETFRFEEVRSFENRKNHSEFWRKKIGDIIVENANRTIIEIRKRNMG